MMRTHGRRGAGRVMVVGTFLIGCAAGVGAQGTHDMGDMHAHGVRGGASTPADVSPSRAPAAAADREMNEMHHGAMTPEQMSHMRMTDRRSATHADSVRAAALVAEMRRSLLPYHDVKAAESDGYRIFLPGVKQPVYHYTSWRRAVGASVGFDASKPTSLLYRDDGHGQMTLVGAMFTAPRGASLAQLDQRVPLGITQWHQHVNWCMPTRGERDRWREMRDGKPVFGPASAIATKEACDAVHGRFMPQVFGWMVHVNAFASDASDVWTSEHE